MEEEEIIASGILQALKRGEHKGKAMQSFLNAGYSKEIVEKAAMRAETMNREGYSATASNVQQKKHITGKVGKPLIASSIGKSKIHQSPERSIGFRPRPPQQNKKEEHLFRAEKPKKSKALVWIIATLIIILTLLINGYLVWKYVLS